MAKLELAINGAVFSCEGADDFVRFERSIFMNNLPAEYVEEETVETRNCLGESTEKSARVIGAPARSASWDSIIPAIQHGGGSLCIGDVVACTLGDGREVDFVVTDETDDAYRFESRDCLGDYVPRNKVDAYFDTVYAAMPKALQDAIIDTERVYFDADGKKCTETRKLFLPSASEIFPPENCLGDKELYKQMDWYKDIHNRVRAKAKGDEVTDWYWTASRYSGNTTHWCLVYTDGSAYDCIASYTYIAAPVCFHISKS